MVEVCEKSFARGSGLLDFRAASATETSRDARFLTHLSIGTRRVMRAPGEVSGSLKSLQNETLLLKARGRLIPARMISDLVCGARSWLRFELGAAGEEKRKKKCEREGGDKAVFKRVLTPRQGPNGPHGGEASGPENYGSACLP
ncbi:Uncharacterized protein DBV15_10010 [Temnothorax longispinosus]|uniref:Uncharacterized protein n=1 Tax=Temnothorax longispinosus TaxID=300112 RepID=A0A4S2KQF5_9HYME|nr:Uncharacterized protein DBV15_10010 [Temnothorax longispinosus]